MKDSKKTAAPVELLQVRKGGRSLYWPAAAGGGLRGGAGTVVPRDDPLVDYDGFVQSGLLEPAEQRSQITPCDCEKAKALYEQLSYTGVPFSEPETGDPAPGSMEEVEALIAASQKAEDSKTATPPPAAAPRSKPANAKAQTDQADTA